MLEITIPATELYDESKNVFIDIPETKLKLEHSLVSLKKWEQKWHVPFLAQENMSVEQQLDYVRCMTITQNVDPVVYYGINEEILLQIKAYIEDPMTAAWFTSAKKEKKSKKVMTAESFYFYMIELNIPIEFQKWHLNSLLTLIKYINIEHENADPKTKKMSKAETLAQMDRINEERKRRLKTNG